MNRYVVAIIGFLSMYIIGVLTGFNAGKQVIRMDAVCNGCAEYFINDNNEKDFRWKKLKQ